MKPIFLLAVCYLAILAATAPPCPDPQPEAEVKTGFCSRLWASNLSRPRSIERASNDDLLVVEASKAQVTGTVVIE